MTSSPKRQHSLSTKKTDRWVGKLSLEFWVRAIDAKFLGWSLLKVGLPDWWSLLNCNISLNCAGSPRRFSSQNYKIESACLIGLAKGSHSWPSLERDCVLLEIRNQNEESCVWSLVATTSLNLAIMRLPRGQTLLYTIITMFISSPFIVT
jgi:hypothetical protein